MADPWEAFDARYASSALDQHIPGLVAAVVSDGRLVHSFAYGVADALTGTPTPTTLDHRFRIASMSKSFTALALLALRDRGQLTLDAAVAEFVPELAGRRPTSDAAPLTLRDLLHHLGGDVTDDPWADRLLGISAADFSAHLLADWPSARPPGTAFGCSNLGYGILGRVVGAVSGMPYQAFIRDLLFTPLGMADTTYDHRDVPGSWSAAAHRWTGDRWVHEVVADDGELGAMGGIITTVGDFARYVGFILDAWPPRDTADVGPLRRSTVRELGTGHGFPACSGPTRKGQRLQRFTDTASVHNSTASWVPSSNIPVGCPVTAPTSCCCRRWGQASSASPT